MSSENKANNRRRNTADDAPTTPRKKTSPDETKEKNVNNAHSNNNSESLVEIIVIYEDARVQVNLSTKDFSFLTIDGWIRSRFGLKADVQLRYMDKVGGEHIPSVEDIIKQNHIYVKRVKSESTKATPSLFDSGLWFSYVFFCVTTATVLLALYSKTHAPTLFPIRKWCDSLDLIMIELGLFPKKGIALDAFMAFVCWSSTYLFIRRLWNPETMRSTIEKYSADSFFGGLAAAGSIILKSILTAILSEK